MKISCSVLPYFGLMVKLFTQSNFDVAVDIGQQHIQKWFDTPKFNGYVKRWVFPLNGKTKDFCQEKVEPGCKSLEGGNDSAKIYLVILFNQSCTKRFIWYSSTLLWKFTS